MRFEPLEDRVLVKVDPPDEQKGLIHIPEGYRVKPQVGTVVAVSGGIRNRDGEMIEPLVQEGERILFGKYTGTDVKIDNVDYIIMREADILGLLKEEESH